MAEVGTLIFLCGKMAAGKSTLSKQLAARDNAILLAQDDLLDQLFPAAIVELADYVKYSTRLKNALAPHVCALLARGVPVVLDFPGNTRMQRAWFRSMIESAGAPHELHFIDVPDDLCKRQLKARSAGRPADSPWTTEAEFDAVTAYFEPPGEDERFNVIRHARD